MPIPQDVYPKRGIKIWIMQFKSVGVNKLLLPCSWGMTLRHSYKPPERDFTFCCLVYFYLTYLLRCVLAYVSIHFSAKYISLTKNLSFNILKLHVIPHFYTTN
jgi:hypothetical protein